MTEQHFFADVTLPFHVWVRETSGVTARWVLRDASGGSQGALEHLLRGRVAAPSSGAPTSPVA